MRCDWDSSEAPINVSNGAADTPPRSPLVSALHWNKPVAEPSDPRSRPIVFTRNIATDDAPFAGERDVTVAVVGPGRSGTTMTAGVLQRLGVEFGDGVDPLGEDTELNAQALALAKGANVWRLPRIRRQMRRTLQARQARWGRFGFKSPHFGRTLFYAADLVPNPVFVFVVRNPMAVAKSWSKTNGSSPFAVLSGTMLAQSATAAFLERTGKPVVTFSFEDGLADPAGLCTQLATALGLSPAPDASRAAVDFVSPSKGYRDTRRFIGHIDGRWDDRVRGWVTDLVKPHMPPMVELYVGSERVSAGRARRERPDVGGRGLHPTGDCGFVHLLPRPLTAADIEQLSIVIREGERRYQFGVTGPDGLGPLTILPTASPLRGAVQ